MTPTYKYKGKPLTEQACVELIIERFNGKDNIPIERISETCTQEHVQRGGLNEKQPKSNSPVTYALYALKRVGFVDNPKKGFWNIMSIDDMIARLQTFL